MYFVCIFNEWFLLLLCVTVFLHFFFFLNGKILLCFQFEGWFTVITSYFFEWFLRWPTFAFCIAVQSPVISFLYPLTVVWCVTVFIIIDSLHLDPNFLATAAILQVLFNRFFYNKQEQPMTKRGNNKFKKK